MTTLLTVVLAVVPIVAVTLLIGARGVAAMRSTSDFLVASRRISPTVGLWPASRPDPLGDYLDALRATIELAPMLALPGHGDPLPDPVGRAHELIAHHRDRLAATAAALGDEPRSAYEVSFPLFGDDLKPADEGRHHLRCRDPDERETPHAE